MQSRFLNKLRGVSAHTIGRGYHLIKNLRMASGYYLQAISNGETSTYHNLSQLYCDMNEFNLAHLYLALAYSRESRWVDAVVSFEKSITGEAFYNLSLIYRVGRSCQQGVISKDRTKEIAYLKKAAQLYSAPAIDYLEKESQCDAEIAILFGDMFANGEIGNHKNITRALHFYLLAARKNSKLALEKVEAQQAQCTNEMLLELAHIYKDIFKDQSKAAQLLVQLMESHHEPAKRFVKNLPNEQAEFIYYIGEAYEQRDNLEQAIDYYAVSNESKLDLVPYDIPHAKRQDPLKKITEYAEAGHAYALLTCAHYFAQQKQFDKAATYALAAAKKDDARANTYLESDNRSAEFYSAVAKKYELGEGVEQSRGLALKYYEKAVAKKMQRQHWLVLKYI